MLFSYNWLQNYIEGGLPGPEKLAQLLTYHSFEVKGLKKNAQDHILDIPVPPNRGDCLSYIGLAQECAALTDSRIKDFNWSSDFAQESQDFPSSNESVQVVIEDEKGCIRYIAGKARNISVGPSPSWLKEKLELSGLNSINNVVDITNYVMLETGQPLHVFDADKIESAKNGKEIIVRRAKKGEKIVTLDDHEYSLDSDVLIIADKKDPLSLAGIKGGKKAEITSQTKNVILESANFDPGLIHSISNKLGLKTDASWRFEHGINVERSEMAIKRAMLLIKEICGGSIDKNLVDKGRKSSSPKEIKLYFNYIDQLLGINISPSEVKEILNRLNFQIIIPEKKEENPDFILVKVPNNRLDVLLPEDLIEEIGRIHGYDKIEEKFPEASLIPPTRNDEVFVGGIIKDILKSSGFSEALNYSFINEEDKAVYQYGDDLLIKVIHPLSAEFKYLRPSLIPNLLKDVIRNSKNFDTIKLFELEKIFYKSQKSEKGFVEKNILAGLMSQKGSLNDSNLSENIFYTLKGVTDRLLKRLGLLDVWYDDYKPEASQNTMSEWEISRSAEIKFGQDRIGFLGEISSDISHRLRLSHQVVMFYLDFDKIIKLANAENEYQPISPYPEVVRDISLIVPDNVKVVDILNKINLVGGELVKDVDLFDIYQNNKVGSDKKSLAFHIIYQAPDRTLTSSEVDKIQEKIIHSLESNSGWNVRR